MWRRDSLEVKQNTSPKWRSAAEEDVENDSGAPNINLLAVVTLQHLRSNVVRTPDNVAVQLP